MTEPWVGKTVIISMGQSSCLIEESFSSIFESYKQTEDFVVVFNRAV